MNEFYKQSYQIHEKSYEKLNVDEQVKLYANWFNNGSVDVWRHLRMLDFLNVFIEDYPEAKWITVGDGRFGTSAIYIEKAGGKAIATDIDVSLLQIAKEKGWIKEYRYENAESLSFPDNEFNYSFCKESFHHFPRAYLALYEMLRVSKKAAILVEPNDWIPSPMPRRILQWLKNSIKLLLGIPVPHPDTGNFEPVGNYVFPVSKREIQKIALGMGLPCVAFKEFNDVYIEGVEHEKADSTSPLFKKIKRKLFFMELLYKIGLSGKNHIIAVVFKEVPTQELQNKLSKIGFKIIKLPANPYLSEQ
ncbi:MAG: class I SAM-dependent methyltransferase [Bacteroidales bacterium]